ncbi:MAG: 1-acyl-sn-glycerol-3-phosphate acyltransferase [Gemmatimonadetes bacterium]|nr:1-acyl-sn-glycerol-3-phosphate acyltransferase [Gemmatimonadota bacterium]
MQLSVLDVLLAAAVIAVALVVGAGWYWRRWVRRTARRAHRRFGARIDRFKLTSKRYITEALLNDPDVAAAVRAHAEEHGVSERQVWERVRTYLREIIPAFSLLMYYQFGYAVSKALLAVFYKVSVDHVRRASIEELPRESIVIYLLNHRSNADFVLASYALAGEVAISYAVGEWARVFPLEYLFKSFGSYFIRRRYREPLYHRVLERYVQLITRNGVTQGIFPEGGLTRDGRLRPAKVGLLDYVLGVAREPGFAERMYVIPVAVNYDRVLEDRTLLRELRLTEGGRRTGRLAQMREVLGYTSWNVGRALSRRWKRYGRAAVVIGEPIPVKPWLDEVADGGPSLFNRPRADRLAAVQVFCDRAMERIGAIIPVTPVPLACAALQTFDADFVPRARLLERMAELRDALVENGARVLRADRQVDESWERAYRMLRMRRVVARAGDGYLILPKGRELVSYYANSIAHLCGEFEGAVKARDQLPVDGMIGM